MPRSGLLAAPSRMVAISRPVLWINTLGTGAVGMWLAGELWDPGALALLIWLTLPFNLLIYGVNTDQLLGGLAYVEGEGTLQFDFARVPLLDGIYTVSIGIHSHDVATIYDHHSAGHTFQVTNPGIAAGLVALDADVTLEHAADRQVAR